MHCLRIQGGRSLAGSVPVSGAKNAALPILAATLLADGPVRLTNVPRLVDVETQSLVLRHLGLSVERKADESLQIETIDERSTRADYELVRRMRASFCVLGPLLARRGKAVVSLPGGCNIGTRPVDVHLRGLAALGASVRIEHGYVIAETQRLRGATIDLRGPCGPTVTGTANVMCAATAADGVTQIQNAACEPEIVDLGQFLIALGADITGLGTSTIRVAGPSRLGDAAWRIIPDRIEAATLLLAAAITRSQATVTQVIPEHLTAVLDVLRKCGVELNVSRDRVSIASSERPHACDLTAQPYPGVPTDVQAQFTALLALAEGDSCVRDEVFPDRFMHVAELNRQGAHLQRSGNQVRIRGVGHYSGTTVMACDLRASAALVLAGLAAEGETIVRRIYHLDRGYAQLDAKLRQLGASIERVEDRQETTLPNSH